MPAGSHISPTDILDAADDILDKSGNLIAAAKTAVDDPENPNNRAQLTQVITAFCSHTDLFLRLCHTWSYGDQQHVLQMSLFASSVFFVVYLNYFMPCHTLSLSLFPTSVRPKCFVCKYLLHRLSVFPQVFIQSKFGFHYYHTFAINIYVALLHYNFQCSLE